MVLHVFRVWWRPLETDSRQAISENDASINDITQTLSDYPLMHGRMSSPQKIATTICGLDIDTVGAYTGTIKLNYNGKK